MRAINEFLLFNDFRIATNPCISPDFCLDWPALCADFKKGEGVVNYPKSRVGIAAGFFQLVENSTGDHAWIFEGRAKPLPGESIELCDNRRAYPATWENLILLKNLIQEHDPESTVFPTATQQLGESTIGVGARFTTLHWPGVDWAMAQLGIGLTANQNSIPRELVYDVNVMLAGKLDRVPFPFIGTDVPEGHQGQSVEGMGHGCVLAKLKSGFQDRKSVV